MLRLFQDITNSHRVLTTALIRRTGSQLRVPCNCWAAIAKEEYHQVGLSWECSRSANMRRQQTLVSSVLHLAFRSILDNILQGKFFEMPKGSKPAPPQQSSLKEMWGGKAKKDKAKGDGKKDASRLQEDEDDKMNVNGVPFHVSHQGCR